MRWCSVFFVLIALVGCTGNTEKGINKHKDMPVPPTAEKQEKPEKK